MKRGRKERLADLLQRGDVWRGRSISAASTSVRQSGIEALDDRIGGFPGMALTEILSSGFSALSLLIPLLARLSGESAWQAWVNPPWVPYAPALLARGVDTRRLLLVQDSDECQALWAAEQLLRSGRCNIVLIWTQSIAQVRVRRLQLAARAGSCPGFLFRPAADARNASPAAMRLQVVADQDGLRVRVLKCRGACRDEYLRVARQ